MTNNKLFDFVGYAIYNHYAGGELEDVFTKEARELISINYKEWEYEDVKKADGIIDSTAHQVLDLDDPFINLYRFDYKNKSDDYKEYDGYTVSAPNEKLAWYIFSGLDGEYKLPNLSEYDIVQVRSAEE